MPYTIGQELTNAAGDVARFDGKEWTIVPKSSQPGATPKEGQVIPPAQNQTSTPADLGRGLYHGSTDFAAGTLGLPGDVGNKITEGYDWATGSHHRQQFPGSGDFKELIDRTVGDAVGGRIQQPKGAIGNFTKMATAYAPNAVMGRAFGPPGQSWLRSTLENTVGPAAASELAGAATNDDPRARFVGAMLGGRALNPIGGRAAQMNDKLKSLSKTYQTREDAFRADPTVLQQHKDIYNGLMPKEGNEWLTKNYQKAQPPEGTWGDLNRENAIAHEIKDSHPIKDTALPLAGGLTAGLFAHRYGLPLTESGVGGIGGYLGVKGIGKSLPIPNEDTVAALLGNNPMKTINGSVMFSNPMRAEKKEK